MEIRNEITGLARNLLERRARGEQPFILFLGRGCADAAGVPSNLQIAQQLFTDTDLAEQYLDPGDGRVDEESLLHAFNEFIAEMTPGQRYRMLQSFFAGLPVPTFYQDLALLIKAGFFRRIITTNIDTLLEQALNGAGLWGDKDYQVISLSNPEQSAYWEADLRAQTRIRIVKLHGDLAQQSAFITPEEILAALSPQRAFVKSELAGDLLMVGYEFESQPLNKWLAWTRGNLWWISPEEPEPRLLDQIGVSRSYRSLHGEQAYPESFFGQLAYILLRRPIKSSLSPEKYQASALEKGLTDVDEALADLDASEFSDDEYLQDQLWRSRALLQNLEQATTPGERNLQIQAQINYQRRKVTDLEDQLRGLDDTRLRVLDLLQKVQAGVAKLGPDDPNIENFLQSQVRTIRREYRRSQPNQSIISAAISSVVVLVERLGAGVVEPATLEELASLAPSSLARRV